MLFNDTLNTMHQPNLHSPWGWHIGGIRDLLNCKALWHLYKIPSLIQRSPVVLFCFFFYMFFIINHITFVIYAKALSECRSLLFNVILLSHFSVYEREFNGMCFITRMREGFFIIWEKYFSLNFSNYEMPHWKFFFIQNYFGWNIKLCCQKRYSKLFI